MPSSPWSLPIWNLFRSLWFHVPEKPLSQGFDEDLELIVRAEELGFKEFWIGEVKARGLKLCEPCSHLQKLSHEKVLPGLVHRGGLRAQILTQGPIRTGDAVLI